MSESRQRASCRKCSTIGPQRSRASEQGWVRLVGGAGLRPIWLCRACAVVDLTQEERDALAEANDSPRTERQSKVEKILTDIFDRESRERAAATATAEVAQ